MDWAQLAADLGYADQAHLTRDFTATLGVPPTRYAESAGGLLGGARRGTAGLAGGLLGGAGRDGAQVQWLAAAGAGAGAF